jgi:O-methyltransferase
VYTSKVSRSENGNVDLAKQTATSSKGIRTTARMTVSNSQVPAEIDTTPSTASELYLDLLKKCLTRYAFPERRRPPWRSPQKKWHGFKWFVFERIGDILARQNLEIVKKIPFDPDKRIHGEDWPAEAETMIGLKRLDNLQHCIVDVMRSGVPGDLIETGVWRGGATIFMRAVLKAYGDTRRLVWVADSFEGLPLPDTQKYPGDSGNWTSEVLRYLAVSIDEVKANFAKYELLDDQVRFLKGWFKDTLPEAPIEKLAVLRLDGDMYSSTIEVLNALYPKLSVGGFAIIDDYNSVPACKKAVDDFRRDNGIREETRPIDRDAIFWQRSAGP